MIRARAIRVGAVVSAVAIAGAIWYLGSPLFIRTTANEALPAASAASVGSPFASGAPSGVTPQPASTTPPPSATASVLQRGQLRYVDALHNGTGTVLHVILSSCCPVADKELVRFEDVAITNAPDVHVYLSTDRGGRWSEATSVYLGPLKATNGSFNYEIPAPLGQRPYGSVVVWCRAFSVLVTWADLDPG